MPPTARDDSGEAVRWGRIVALFVVAAVIVEIAAQAFVYVWVGEPFRSFSKFRWSPYGLVRNNPDLTQPSFHNNNFGFRNLRDTTREKGPNTLRVLILGGSVAYAGLASRMIEGAERPDSASTVNAYLEEELKRDPELRGVNVEVLNAAVQFNSSVEVSASYVAEYAAWDADVVIVMGSSNNFQGDAPRRGDVVNRRYAMTAPHPWFLEFERVANRRSLGTVVEHALLALDDHLASVALLRKVTVRAVDRIMKTRDRRALLQPPKDSRPLASYEEWDAYVDQYLGHASAIVASARQNDQEVVFFWEYFLRHLGGIRDYSRGERGLLPQLSKPTDAQDAAYNFHARDRVRAWLTDRDVRFLDPIDVMRTERESVFIDYLHYTPSGNHAMARFMATELRDVVRERARRIRAH